VYAKHLVGSTVDNIYWVRRLHLMTRFDALLTRRRVGSVYPLGTCLCWLCKNVPSALQARSEVYAGHLRGRLCFLPGIPWLQLGRRVLPELEIQVGVSLES